MAHGVRALSLRLWFGGETVDPSAGRGKVKPNQLNRQDLTDDQMRDIGIMDGRVSPSSIKCDGRPEQWRLLERPPRWL